MSVLDPWSAITLSIQVATIATLLSLPFALALGYVLARREFWGKTIVEAVAMLPLVLPPVVTGLLLLKLLGRNSWIGGMFAALGLPLSFSTAAVVLAAAVVGFPLLLRATRSAFELVDVRYEQLSRTLGLRAWPTFVRVTLPLAAPGILAGCVLSFTRALGEFGATVVLAGNIEGQTRTIALAVYALLDAPSEHDAMVPLLGASVALSLLAVIGHESLLRRHRARLELHRG
jgi:molybdate transport system permease protein